MMQDKTQENDLLFDGSVWCNLDVALRSVDQALRRRIRPSELTVIEWYILRALYENDGQHASELARAVGRAATSFTPNLDKLQSKDYIERRPDSTDRRAVRIFLTEKGHNAREEVLQNAVDVDREMRELFDANDFASFESVVRGLQILENLG